MTDRVRPSVNAPGKRHELATAIAVGAGSPGWVVPSGEVELADEDVDLDAGALNAFAATAGGASLDVTIDPGEAFVGGAWLARDTASTVTLAASTVGQTVYLGWDKGQRDTVLVGLDADFAADDRRIPLWTFDTDGAGVTASVDERDVGQTMTPDILRAEDVLRVPVYAAKADIPTDLPDGTIAFARQETTFYGEDGN